MARVCKHPNSRSLIWITIINICYAASLQSFARIVGEPRSQAFDLSKSRGPSGNPSAAPSTSPSAATSSETLPSATSNDTYLIQQICKRQDSLETQHSLHIDDMLPVIRNATADLREACCDGVATMQASIDAVNKNRWRTDADGVTKSHQEFEASIAQLSATLAAFKETNRKWLIEPYMPMLRNADTREARRDLPLRSLYLSYVFATNLIVVGDVLLSLMEQVRTTSEKRKSNRLWAPKGLRAIKKLFTERNHDDTAAAFGEDEVPEQTETELKQGSYSECYSLFF